MRPRRPDMESAIALYCVAPDQPQPPALPPPEPIALFNPEYALPKCPSLLPYQDKILHGFRGDGEKRAEWFAASSLRVRRNSCRESRRQCARPAATLGKMHN